MAEVLQKQDKNLVLHLGLTPPFYKHFLLASMPGRASVIPVTLLYAAAGSMEHVHWKKEM